MARLDEMFANEEATFVEVWACAYPGMCIWSILVIQWQHYWCFGCLLPCAFKLFPPRRQFLIACLTFHHDI